MDVDTRTDVYSLGVLLYELLVGRTPFDSQELLAAGWDALLRTLRDEEPVRPSTRLRTLSGQDLTRTATRRRREVPQLVSELRGDLDWIVLKCLEKDRGRRYDSVGALAQDVVRHLRDEPIVARPPTLAYRLQKTFQRNRLACTAGALVAVTLLVASGFSVWTMLREKAARAVAEQQTVRANRETAAARTAERTARQAAYAADMQAAELALKDHNPGRAHLFGVEQGKFVRWCPQDGTREELPFPLKDDQLQYLATLGRDQLVAGSYSEPSGGRDGVHFRRKRGPPPGRSR